MPKAPKFTEGEDNCLLTQVENELPTGGDQWTRVAMRFNSQMPQGSPHRDADSLKERFKKLRNSTKPTGDPDCPPAIRRAKRLWVQIQGVMAVQTEGSPLYDDDEEGEEEVLLDLGANEGPGDANGEGNEEDPYGELGEGGVYLHERCCDFLHFTSSNSPSHKYKIIIHIK
jgi:hypothetical protein